MRMYLTSDETTQHLVEELGVNQPYRECVYHKSIIVDALGHHIRDEFHNSFTFEKPGEQRA